MKPFGGFRGQTPGELGAECGLTLRAWWSFGKPWQAGATIVATSGEDRISQFAPAFPAAPQPLITQTVDANRPRFYDVLSKGQKVPHGESGRAAWLECGDATIKAMADSQTGSYTAMGVSSFVGAARSPIWWWSPTGFESPLFSNGTQLRSYRWTTASGSSNILIGALSVMEGPVAWCITRFGTYAGTPDQYTWINGEYMGWQHHTATANITALSAFIGDTSATATEASWSELILFGGTPDVGISAQPDERFGPLTPIYNSMRARWGV
jgi:hypothetical protein